MGIPIERSWRRFALAAGALLMAAAPAYAAPVASSGEARSVILSPLSLVKTQDLSFGDIAAGATAGTVVLDPETGTRTVTGGVMELGGSVDEARFIGYGTPSANVGIIREPKGSVVLTRAGGTETMILNNFTISGGNGARQLRPDGIIEFGVGGTLAVGANQPDGEYEGTFTVLVEYR